MTNEVVSTKDIRTGAQSPCACKDKQHMQVLECVLMCECFSSAFCKILRRHYFLPIVLVTERGRVQQCVGVTRLLFYAPTSLLGTWFQQGKLELPFGIWPYCLCSHILHAGTVFVSSLSGKNPMDVSCRKHSPPFVPSGEYLFVVKHLLFYCTLLLLISLLCTSYSIALGF